MSRVKSLTPCQVSSYGLTFCHDDSSTDVSMEYLLVHADHLHQADGAVN